MEVLVHEAEEVPEEEDNGDDHCEDSNTDGTAFDWHA